jgi:hypothetical protein
MLTPTKDRTEALLTLIAEELFLARIHRHATQQQIPDAFRRAYDCQPVDELREQLGLASFLCKAR